MVLSSPGFPLFSITILYGTLNSSHERTYSIIIIIWKNILNNNVDLGSKTILITKNYEKTSL